MPAGSTYSTIATTTVSSATSTITLSSIPSTYTDLVLIVAGSTSTGTTHSVNIRVNGDTGSNYSDTQLDGTGSAAASYRDTNQTSMNLGIFATPNQSNSIFHFQNYANTTTYKTVLARGNNPADYIRLSVGLWRSTSAINSISVYNPATTYASGTTITLYGITAA